MKVSDHIIESSPGAAVASLSSHDADEQARRFSRLDQRYDQLSGGAFVGGLEYVTLGRLTLFRESLGQSVHQTGGAPADSLTFASACELSGNALWNGHSVGVDAMVAFVPGREFDLRTPHHAVCVGISIERQPSTDDAFERVWEQLELVGDVWSSSGIEHRCFNRLVTHALDTISATPKLWNACAVGEQLTDELLGAVLEWQMQGDTGWQKTRGSRYASIARQARALMLERIAEPISIQVLCDIVGCSRRALQYAFNSVYGVGPVAYLRALRLNAVRRELQWPQSGTTVLDEASKRGFWHFSRFAREYAQLFGEKPSQTLARGRNMAS